MILRSSRRSSGCLNLDSQMLAGISTRLRSCTDASVSLENVGFVAAVYEASSPAHMFALRSIHGHRCSTSLTPSSVGHKWKWWASRSHVSEFTPVTRFGSVFRDQDPLLLPCAYSCSRFTLQWTTPTTKATRIDIL
jgi:hypothetical protein